MRVPVILQSDRAECGLACIAMVAAFHGVRENLRQHRSTFRISQHGSTLAQLRHYAEGRGFHCRAVRLDLDALAHLERPAILHWNLAHFVVLEAVGRRSVRIVDPAFGRRRLALHEVSKRFTGVAMEMAPSPQIVRSTPSQKTLRLRDFLPALQGLGTSLVAVLFMTILLQAFTLAVPLSVQFTVDQGVRHGDIGTVGAVAVGFALLAVLSAVTEWLRTLTVLHLGNLSAFRMVVPLARWLLRLPDVWFVAHHTGDVMSRFDSTGPIRNFMMTGAFAILIDGSVAVGAILILLWYSPMMGGVALAFLACNLAVRYTSAGKLAALTDEMIAALARERSAFIENVERQRVIKLLGVESLRGDIWEARYVTSVNAGARQLRFVAHVDFVAGILGGVEPIVILAIGASKVLDGSLTLGMLFAFLSYATLLSTRARLTVAAIVELRLLKVHRDRVAEIALEETEAQTDVDNRPHLRGGLDVRDVKFGYGDFAPLILNGLGFRVGAGEFLAITGGSGVGKSTLVKLLCGLLHPQQGEILVGGIPLQRLNVGWYRSQLGVVMQDDDLFTGTLAENIGLDASDDMDRVREAAKLACIHDDIEEMPMAYRTLVGYMGAALSGGQRQRVMIARAIFRKPTIFLLDEGTAHLDDVVKRQVLSNLRSTGATVIFVTHDDAVVAEADRCLELQR